MSEGGTKPGGTFPSIRRMGDSLLALAQGRLQLFALELQSEKMRLIDLLLRLGIVLALGGMGLTVGTVALAIYLWERARYVGLLLGAGLFFVAAAATLWRLREVIRRGPAPFAETAAEFKKDRACLEDKG